MCNFLLLLEFFETDFLFLCKTVRKKIVIVLFEFSCVFVTLEFSKSIYFVSHLLSLSYQAVLFDNCQHELFFVTTLILVNIHISYVTNAVPCCFTLGC